MIKKTGKTSRPAKKAKRKSPKHRGLQLAGKVVSFFTGSRKKAVISGVVLFLAVFAVSFSVFSEHKGTIILAVNSQACHCVKNRCANMEGDIKKAMAEFRLNEKAGLKVYDLAKGKRAEKVMDKYQMGLVPCMVLVDRQDQVKYRASVWEFDKNSLKDAVLGLSSKASK